MKITCFSVVALCLGFSGVVNAMEDCSKKASDPDVFICAETNKVTAEKELNTEYLNARKRVTVAFSAEETVKKEYMTVFTEVQRGWLKYRDNQCKLEAHIADKGSNPYIVFTNNCIARLDEERTAQLKQIPYDG
ncbi:DUF1311 domain-containing protein [Erwiniaceae bacterium BAC15a-03b]|uniref:DUF1311 domain-containing protein n=1 Tax=Winslowiella arboricola TaxID=2978220 RepID=A0A9J6PUC1_9GAMM|nr:lysozyme inhibitor LprI family protein [Winslowiella arboricola]MCU5771110.1 DUF1311 domain-containing protein [Winslowiella arboricola]MCU5777631.1 DUF1311 domain-containing protein [Winslowiella arboricola]